MDLEWGRQRLPVALSFKRPVASFSWKTSNLIANLNFLINSMINETRKMGDLKGTMAEKSTVTVTINFSVNLRLNYTIERVCESRREIKKDRWLQRADVRWPWLIFSKVSPRYSGIIRERKRTWGRNPVEGERIREHVRSFHSFKTNLADFQDWDFFYPYFTPSPNILQSNHVYQYQYNIRRDLV